jgi:DNA (cytosine-5)-methyltransferase 1
MANKITFGSLFTGVGGFDLGFERAGMKCVWQCEIDKYANQILEKQFPNVKRYIDVKEIGKENLESVDVICGGFPCQDLSVAGKRKGLAGSRSGLWWEFARIIDELEPKWVVAENVPGLLSSNKGQDFALIIRWLVERGYGVSWRILDSQYFGVPQRRRRVFIVGSFGSGRSAQVLFESKGVPGDFKASGYTWEENSTNVARSITTNEGQRQKVDQENYIISQQDDGRNNGVGGISIQKTDKACGISSKSTTFTVRSGCDGGGKGFLSSEEQEMTLGGQKQYLWQQRYDEEVVRVNNQISPTLAKSHSTIPYYGVRRLTPKECERLQGFPDGWCSNIVSDTQSYKQMGNAVTVNVAEWMGRRLVKRHSAP